MLIRLFIPFILFTLLFNTAYSQTDSTEAPSDSIVYVPDTVIIKQTFYLRKAKRIRKDTLSWYVGAGYDFGKNFISSSADYNNISTIYGCIGKKSKNLYTEVGIGLMYMNASPTNTYQTSKQGQNKREVTDTIDIYYQLQNNIFVPVYVTEKRTVTDVFTYQADSTTSQQIKLTYVQIPINFTYLFSIKKFKIGPTIGIKPCFLLTDATMYKSYDINSYLLYGNAGINIAYEFSKKVMVSANLNEQFTFQKSSKEAIGTLPFQNIGLAVKYFF